LRPHNLEHKVKEINFEGARLAREACKDKAWVFGSVGPLGKPMEPVGKITFDDAKSYFLEQIEGLMEGGVDFILLETFNDLKEITQALISAKEL